MIKSKGIFAVSFIAMMVAGGAYANIASQGYVDQQIDTRQVAGDYATNEALGTVRETATNAQSAAAAAKTAADAAASAAATAQQTANAKVTANAAITAGTATKITYDAKGLVTGGASLTASDIPTIPSTKVSGLSTVATSGSYNDLDDKPSIPSAYVLKAATDEALGGVKSGGDITVATSGTVTVSHATKADSATTATSADHADTATTATSATSATNATNDADGNEITETYATKDELTSGLAGKQATLSAAQLNAVNSGITSAKVTTYDGYNAKITAAQTAADEAASAASAAQSTINNLDVSTASGSGNVVTSVTQSNGKISVTKGNVQIPVGSATATTSYATIWVE